MHTHDLDAKIATLEAELQHLKQQRAQGRQPKALDGIRVVDLGYTATNIEQLRQEQVISVGGA
jgi:hypothetical protein